MLMQDPLTGRLHEIPDQPYRSRLGAYGQFHQPQWGGYPQQYGYSPQRVSNQVLYDGLGNPVGIFPILAALAPLAAKVAPMLAKRFLPQLAKRFLPMINRAAPMINQAAPIIGDFLQGPPHECRCARRFRRRFAVPPPPVPELSREAGHAEPAGAVHGPGNYEGFNGYGGW
jgi:hypothetical protein